MCKATGVFVLCKFNDRCTTFFIKKKLCLLRSRAFGDPYGNRTHVTAVKGPCLNLLTNGPSFEGYTGEMPKHLSGLVAATGFEPVTLRV